MSCRPRHSHVPILFEFCVVALGLFRDTVPEEASGEGDVLVLNGEYLVEAAQIVQLVDLSLFDLSGKLLPSHLVPKESTLLVHFLQLSVTHNPIKVLLPVGFIDPQDLECVLHHCLLYLVV